MAREPFGPWYQWITEHEEDAPTHRLHVLIALDIDVVVPPWLDKSGLIGQVMENSDWGQTYFDLVQQWNFDEPQVVIQANDGQIACTVEALSEPPTTRSKAVAAGQSVSTRTNEGDDLMRERWWDRYMATEKGYLCLDCDVQIEWSEDCREVHEQAVHGGLNRD